MARRDFLDICGKFGTTGENLDEAEGDGALPDNHQVQLSNNSKPSSKSPKISQSPKSPCFAAEKFKTSIAPIQQLLCWRRWNSRRDGYAGQANGLEVLSAMIIACQLEGKPKLNMLVDLFDLEGSGYLTRKALILLLETCISTLAKLATDCADHFPLELFGSRSAHQYQDQQPMQPLSYRPLDLEPHRKFASWGFNREQQVGHIQNDSVEQEIKTNDMPADAGLISSSDPETKGGGNEKNLHVLDSNTPQVAAPIKTSAASQQSSSSLASLITAERLQRTVGALAEAAFSYVASLRLKQQHANPTKALLAQSLSVPPEVPDIMVFSSVCVDMRVCTYFCSLRIPSLQNVIFANGYWLRLS